MRVQPFASSIPGGGLYPALEGPPAAVNKISITMGVPTDEIATGVTGPGDNLLFLWTDGSEWESPFARICFYPESGDIGVACPTDDLWVPIGFNEKNGAGAGLGCRFALTPLHRYWRFVDDEGSATILYWALLYPTSPAEAQELIDDITAQLLIDNGSGEILVDG